LNYLDLIIGILLAWAAWRGFSKGLVVMVSAFIALIVGIWGAVKFSSLVGEWLANTLNVSTPYMNLVSFTVTFIAIVITINIAAYIVSRLLDAIALGFINRILGGLFSVLTMGLVLSVLFVILNAFDERHNFLPANQVESSVLYGKIAGFAPRIFPFLHFNDIAREIEDLLTGNYYLDIPFLPRKGFM